MASSEPPQASPKKQQAEHHGASSSSSSSNFHGARHNPNSNISAVGVNPNIAMAPVLQAPVQVIHHPVVEVPVEAVVLFERGFLPNWEDKMNLNNPGLLTIHPAITEWADGSSTHQEVGAAGDIQVVPIFAWVHLNWYQDDLSERHDAYTMNWKFQSDSGP